MLHIIVVEVGIRFFGGNTNLYGYVLNDPINLIDPSGLIAPRFIPNWGKGPRWPNYPTTIYVNWNLLGLGASTIVAGATIADGAALVAATRRLSENRFFV